MKARRKTKHNRLDIRLGRTQSVKLYDTAPIMTQRAGSRMHSFAGVRHNKLGSLHGYMSTRLTHHSFLHGPDWELSVVHTKILEAFLSPKLTGNVAPISHLHAVFESEINLPTKSYYLNVQPCEKQVPLTYCSDETGETSDQFNDYGTRDLQLEATPRATVKISGNHPFPVGVNVFGLRGRGIFHFCVSRSARQLAITPTHRAAMAIHATTSLVMRDRNRVSSSLLAFSLQSDAAPISDRATAVLNTLRGCISTHR